MKKINSNREDLVVKNCLNRIAPKSYFDWFDLLSLLPVLQLTHHPLSTSPKWGL